MSTLPAGEELSPGDMHSLEAGRSLAAHYLLQADTNSERLFTVNDVKVGGSKYGIIGLHGLNPPTFKVNMHENLYFTNRKVRPLSLQPCSHFAFGPEALQWLARFREDM